jgi:ketosteroid isomerase-like protein
LTAKDTVQTYFDKLAAGDARGAFALFEENATYRLIGSTPFTSRLVDQKIDLVADELIAEGDTVVALAHSKAVALTGLPYENEYAIVFRVKGGRITSLTEYLDTALVETAIFGKKLLDEDA